MSSSESTPDPRPEEPAGTIDVEKGAGRPSLADVDWEKAQSEPEFQELRRRLRRFIFPVAGLFLVWYLLYVLLASYAPEFMSVKVVGNINIGLIFGLLQFVSTFAITTWYVRFADKRVDPLAGAIRDELGGGK